MRMEFYYSSPWFVAMARSFHFTTNPSSLWTQTDIVGTFTWSQSGTDENVVRNSGTGQTVFIRDTDTADEQTVEIRAKASGWTSINQGFAVVANYVDSGNFYMAHIGKFNNKDNIFRVTGGTYFVIASTTDVYVADTYVRIKITTVNNGANKDLEMFRDGVSVLTASTSTKYGTEQAGIFYASSSSAQSADFDWWAFDLDIVVNSVAPPSGPEAGGQSVDIVGSDIGDGSIGEFGGVNATNNLATPNTSLTCDTPSLAAGIVDVRVKFGTPGSEEYSGILIDGYLYIAVAVAPVVVTPATQAIFMGVDISAFVTSWGRLEQIKDVLLAQATLLTTEMTIQVQNAKKFLNPKGDGSLIGGLNWYDQILELKKGGLTVYEGLVKDIRPSAEAGTADIVSENILKKPAETVVVSQATGANPSQAMLALLRLVLEDEKINAGTFDQAGAAATSASATINYTFTQNDGVTLLQAIQQISELSAISVFVKDNRVVARPFIPYQGNEAGLRFEINDDIVREWGPFSFDNSSFNNEVSVGYPTDQDFVLTDTEAVKLVGIVRRFPFPADAQVVASNLTSAQFFARLYLRRASKRRGKLSVAMGKEAKGVAIGDRFPITTPSLGLSRFPMEAIEVHPTLDTDETELAFAQIFET